MLLNGRRDGRHIRIAGDVNVMWATSNNEETFFSHDDSISALHSFHKFQANEVEYVHTRQLVMDNLWESQDSTSM